MGRVFSPFAHWADYRWHINHYRLALFSLKGGLVCFVAGAFSAFVDSPSWLGASSFAIALVNIWTCQHWLRDLGKASEAFEREPCQVPRAAIWFVIFPPAWRASFCLIAMSIYANIMALALLLGSFSIAVQMLYLPAMVAMYYFAGVIPSGRARRPKKERAPAFPLEPVPIR